ncbi:MAG TPA: O-antigen ligase family protein [Terriglobia bacterium]|nr:O-antigen ligase family protein [Terriglobia bacterium]
MTGATPVLVVGLHLGLSGHYAYLLAAAGIGAFLASVFWRPSVGLYLLAFTLPMQTTRYKLHGFPLGDQFIDILVLGVTLGLLIHHGKIELKTPLSGYLLFFGLFCYLSLFQGSFYLGAPLPFRISDPRFSNWKNYVEMFYLCILTADVIRTKKQAKILLVVMALSLLLVNRSFHSTIAGRDLSHFSYSVRDAGALGYAGENGFAAFEAMYAAFLLGLWVYQKKILLKLAILALVLTCVYCLLYSFSRESYLGFLAALVLLGLFKERKLLVLVALLLITWQAILPRSVQERILMTTENTQSGQKFDSSAEARIELWEDAKALFRQNPVIGLGFDTYEFLGRVGPYRDTHNYYMKALSETGIVGIFLFLWLLKKMWKLGNRLFKTAEDPFWQSMGLGFMALMGSIVVLNFFGDRWTYQQLDGWMWILLGCVIRGLFIVDESAEAEEVSEEEEPVSSDALPAMTIV